MTSTIKSTRLSRGMSVNELAKRMDVTPSAISQLERSEADGTIKLKSLDSALSAMGCTLRISAGTTSAMTQFAPFKVSETMSTALLVDKDPTFALRLLTQAAQEVRAHRELFDPTDLETAPAPLPDPRWDVFMRAMFAHALEANKPAWTEVQPLSQPWFVSRFLSLRKRAETSTPEFLKKLNIYIDERSVTRA